MKKLFVAILLFTVGVYAQNTAPIPTYGDTTDLKLSYKTGIVLLEQYGGTTWDVTGGGLFHLVDASTYDALNHGIHTFDSPISGKEWARIQWIGGELSDFNTASIATLTLGTVDAFSTTGDITIDGTASGLDLQGAYTNAAIDLTDVVLDHSGSSGPVMIRAGTYAAPVTSADPHQSGMIRMYGRNSATTDDGTGFYDRIIFANSQITGNKSAFPISSLVEIRDVGANDGPVAAMAGQFIAHMTETGSKLDSTASVTDGMFGSWFKVASIVGSVADATSRVAPIWIDNQMSGTVSGEEYGIFATTGGTVPDAFIGFETTSAGWDQLFYFDETAYDQEPISGASLKVLLNATQYYIPLSTSADIPTFEGIITDAQTVSPTSSVVADSNVISVGVTSVNVDNAHYDANDFIVLPAITSVPVGHTITIVANGNTNFELRTVAESNVKINNVDADGDQEYLVTDANTVFIHKVSDAYGWVAYDFDHVGAIVAAHVPN